MWGLELCKEVRPKDYRTVTTGVGFRAQCEGVRQKKLLDCYYRCVGSEFSVKESDKKNYRTVTTDVWVQSSVWRSQTKKLLDCYYRCVGLELSGETSKKLSDEQQQKGRSRLHSRHPISKVQRAAHHSVWYVWYLHSLTWDTIPPFLSVLLHSVDNTAHKCKSLFQSLNQTAHTEKSFLHSFSKTGHIKINPFPFSQLDCTHNVKSVHTFPINSDFVMSVAYIRGFAKQKNNTNRKKLEKKRWIIDNYSVQYWE